MSLKTCSDTPTDHSSSIASQELTRDNSVLPGLVRGGKKEIKIYGWCHAAAVLCFLQLPPAPPPLAPTHTQTEEKKLVVTFFFEEVKSFSGRMYVVFYWLILYHKSIKY